MSAGPRQGAVILTVDLRPQEEKNGGQRWAHVEGRTQREMFRALTYCRDRSMIGKVSHGKFSLIIPASLSNEQATQLLWQAFRFPQVLDGWVTFEPYKP